MTRTHIPLITIIGVPNTGKSTLFNRLLGQRKALVHSQPGMTRDIYKKPFEINGKLFHLQDSGGFFPDDQIISEEINKRIYKEAKKSDLILFLFDGRREMLGYEKDLFLEVRKLNSNILSIINKVDNLERYILPNSYYEIKQDFLRISAEHNIAVEEILDAIEIKFKDIGHETEIINETQPRISIVGKPNVGKSSIINRILNDDFVIVSPVPGTTRDSVDIEIKRSNKTFILVDNAGIRKLKKVKEDTETAAVIRAEKDIQNADIVIFVVDVSKRMDQNDLLIAQKVLKSAKPVILACNKWDLVAESEKQHGKNILEDFKRKLNSFYFAPFILVSAVTGKNIFQLIDKAEEIHAKINEKVKTSHVNRVIPALIKEKKLLTESGKVFSSKYMRVESRSPFFIHFFANTDQRLKSSSELYLKKRIVQELGLEGIPVFFNISSKNKE